MIMTRIIIAITFVFGIAWCPNILFAQSISIKPDSIVTSVWASMQYNDLRKFELNCHSNEHPVCVYARFVLGRSDAKTFLLNSRFNKQVIRKAIAEDQSLSHFYYQSGKANPMGNGYVFSILDMAFDLSDIYPQESFLTLLAWYRESEGEYAEYSKEKLRIFLKKKQHSKLMIELRNKYSKDISDINEK